MSDNHILVERPEAQPGVLVIRFNRPEKKNAITSVMYNRMTAALEEANGEDDEHSDEGVQTEPQPSTGESLSGHRTTCRMLERSSAGLGEPFTVPSDNCR